MKFLKISFLFVPLMIGGLIYIIFRSENLLMFKWFQFLNIDHFISKIRHFNTSDSFPNWLRYSLPDGLWILSYVLIMNKIWNNKITIHNLFWTLIIPAIAILSEFFQYFGLIKGTFDFLDLLFYIIGATLPLLFYNKFSTSILIKNYEKN